MPPTLPPGDAKATMAAGDAPRRAGFALCLTLAPAILACIELFHPAGFTKHPGMYEFLSHAHEGEAYSGPGWWFILHMVQTPLIGLVALGLWLLADDLYGGGDPVASGCLWLARAAIFVFGLYYTVLDAIAGIGLGRTIQIVQELQASGTLTPIQVDGVKLVLNRLWTDPWAGGVGSFVSQTGSWAVLVASIATAWGLLRRRAAGGVTLVALVGFGWELHTSHASPHGPAAFALLIVASTTRWWRKRRECR